MRSRCRSREPEGSRSITWSAPASTPIGGRHGPPGGLLAPDAAVALLGDPADVNPDAAVPAAYQARPLPLPFPLPRWCRERASRGSVPDTRRSPRSCPKPPEILASEVRAPGRRPRDLAVLPLHAEPFVSTARVLTSCLDVHDRPQEHRLREPPRAAARQYRNGRIVLPFQSGCSLTGNVYPRTALAFQMVSALAGPRRSIANWSSASLKPGSQRGWMRSRRAFGKVGTTRRLRLLPSESTASRIDCTRRRPHRDSPPPPSPSSRGIASRSTDCNTRTRTAHSASGIQSPRTALEPSAPAPSASHGPGGGRGETSGRAPLSVPAPPSATYPPPGGRTARPPTAPAAMAPPAPPTASASTARTAIPTSLSPA